MAASPASRTLVSGFAGRMGRLFLGGNEFCADDWDIQEVANEEDTSNTCGCGFAEQEFGVRRLEGTINASWKAADNPFAGPPALTVGAKFPNTKLYIHSDPAPPNTGGGATGPFFQFTLQVGTGLQVSVPIRGKIEITIPFVSHGAYTLPTSEVSTS